MDLIFLSILLFSLTFLLGSIFFYSSYVAERVSVTISRIPAAILCLIFGTVGETQSGKELYFTGSDAQEIRAAYEATREQYLDIGHVKAVVFGASLQENGETFKKVLNGMEAESSLGNSPCIFTTESLGELEEMVEKQELSLGDFLTGLYENRTDVSAQSPVKLADLYRAFHKNMVLPEIPAIEIDKSIVKVSGT